METYQWVVVGAGPAGIAALGKLIDLGNVDSNMGLWKFMNYLNRIVPVWQKYGA